MDRTELYRVSTQILENIINDEKNDNNILFDMDTSRLESEPNSSSSI